MQRAAEHGEPAPRGTADLYMGMNGLHSQRDDLPTATQHLLRSEEVSERTEFPHNRPRWCAAMAPSPRAFRTETYDFSADSPVPIFGNRYELRRCVFGTVDYLPTPAAAVVQGQFARTRGTDLRARRSRRNGPRR
jgi:hypothetical protein